MRNPAQAGLDAADDHIDFRIRFPHPLRIDHHRPVRPLVGVAVGGVGVLGAYLAVRGVAVDHRIHIAGSDAEIQIGPSQRAEVVHRQPVGLGQDADPEALRLEQPSHQRHAEAGVVDVGVACHQDHVAAIPAQRVHLRPGGRQESRRLDIVGTMTRVGTDVFQCFHGGPKGKAHAPPGRSCRGVQSGEGESMTALGKAGRQRP